MNPYSNIGFTEDEVVYFGKLYQEATQEGPFEGLRAVKFLQKSKLPNPQLKEIWSKAAFKKQKQMAQDEFNIAMKYIALCQNGYAAAPEILEKEQYNVTLPFFEGIEYPQISLVTTKKESVDEFADFVEAPKVEEVKREEIQPSPSSSNDTTQKAGNRTQLIDEAFGDLTPAITPTPVPTTPINETPKEEPKSTPIVSSEPMPPTEQEEEDEFGEFQESVAAPVQIPPIQTESKKGTPPIQPENKKEMPLIYRLDSEEAKAQEGSQKPEVEVVEDIVIKDDDSAGNQDKTYVEEQKYEYTQEVPKVEERKTLADVFVEIEASPLPETKVESKPDVIESKPEHKWADLLDLDFVKGQDNPDVKSAPAPSAENIEQSPPHSEIVTTLEQKVVDNTEISEQDLLQGFVNAFGRKETNLKFKEEPKKVQTPPKEKPDDTKNAFFMGERPKPILGDNNEKDICMNTSFLKQLEEWLWYTENVITYKKLHEHVKILDEMNTYLAKKKEATANEEFELAIEYRNKANAAKEKLLSDSTIKEFLIKETPKETMSDLIDKVISIGDLQLYEFFKEKYLEKFKDAHGRKDSTALTQIKAESTKDTTIAVMTSKKGIEKLRSQIDSFCECIKTDSEQITEFFEVLRNSAKEDGTIESEITNSTKYKNFVIGVKQLVDMIERMIDVIDILKNMSHIYVFDFESFYEQLKEYWGVIDSNIPPEDKPSEANSPLSEICDECFHSVEETIEYKGEKYHASCINYRLVRMK